MKITPTVPWMRQQFAIYNAKYFGNSLPVPKFVVANLDREWGKFDIKAKFYKRTREIFDVDENSVVITLTKSYAREESAIIDTLLHEMIHEYINLVMKIYPKDPHGPEFTSIANRINADGHNIEEITFITDNDVNPNIKNSVILIISKPRGTDYRYWICKVDPSQITQFKATAARLPGINYYVFYELDSDCLRDVPSDPIYLTGWRGMTYGEVINKMCAYLGVEKTEFDGMTPYKPSPPITP